ncbi:MAG: glycerophosphodiester phosphodiesterase family protein, partial [Myxococcota bacterium]
MRRPDRTQVIAHRGASGYRPQNTLAAYELAVEQRADMIEIDLHRSRDGAIVIRHDEELQSLGGRGDIVEMDLAEIETLDGGQGEKIPTLDEVLDQFGTEMPFNLELKCGERGAYPDLEADTLAAVERRGLLGSTLFSSFDDGVLARLRSQSERARL